MIIFWVSNEGRSRQIVQRSLGFPWKIAKASPRSATLALSGGFEAPRRVWTREHDMNLSTSFSSMRPQRQWDILTDGWQSDLIYTGCPRDKRPDCRNTFGGFKCDRTCEMGRDRPKIPNQVIGNSLRRGRKSGHFDGNLILKIDMTSQSSKAQIFRFSVKTKEFWHADKERAASLLHGKKVKLKPHACSPGF